MKKFLSMVLALVMTMSLVTISAGAKSFTDDSKITYKEAVDVVSEIGIVDGYTDGAFNPTNTLTRGAAAKIICNLILGPTTAGALSADTAPFQDVPVTNDFAGYIAYCAKEGIISGYADGTFRPGNSLSGYAFMKMLLGALGYDAAIQGFTGANWTVNVAKLALGIELNAGLVEEFNGNEAVTREEACLYAFNTLKATMVEYGSKTTVEVNGATVNVGGQDYSDVVNNTSSDGNIDNDDRMQFAERYFTNLKKANTSNDAMGRPAVEWRYKSNSIGTYADSTKLEASYTAGVDKGDLYTLVGKSVVDDFDSKDATLEVFVDGEEVSKPAVDDYFVKSSTSSAAGSGRGVLTEVYVDDAYGADSDETLVTIVVVNTYLVQAAGDYNSTKEEVSIELIDDYLDTTPSNFPTTISQDDFDVSEVQENDYLLVTFSADADEIQTIAPAETVTGEVSSYKVRDSVTVDGTQYKYNKLVNDEGKEEEFSVGDDATLIMDSYGYIMYVDEAVSSSSYVYIRQFGSTSSLGSKAVASAYFVDGTSGEIAVKKVTDEHGNAITSSSAISGLDVNGHGWYTYSKDSNDKYTLRDASLASKYDSGVQTYAKTEGQIVFNGKVSFAKTPLDVKANSSTVFLVLDNDDNVSVYTGVANVPDITLKPGTTNGSAYVGYVAKDNKYATYVFIDVNANDATIDDATTSNDYLFVLQTSGKKVSSSADDYYEYDVVTEGSVATVKIAEDAYGDLDAGVLYHKIKTNSNDYITGATAIVGNHGDPANDQIAVSGVAYDTANTGKKISYSDSTLTIDGHDFVLTDDASLNLIVDGGDDNAALLSDDGKDFETYLGVSGRSLASSLNGYYYTYDYYIVLDDDGSDTIDVLYVWVTSSASTSGSGSSNTPNYDTDVVVVNDSFAISGGQVTFDWYVEDPSVKDLDDDDVFALLDANGCSDIVAKGAKWSFTRNGRDYTDQTVVATRTYALTVDGETTYLKKDDTKAISNSTSNSGKGYIVSVGGANATYAAYGDYKMTEEDTVITTGYVTYAGVTEAATCNDAAASVATATVTSSVATGYARAGSTITVTVTFDTVAASVTNGATVTLSGGSTLTKNVLVDDVFAKNSVDFVIDVANDNITAAIAATLTAYTPAP